MPKKFTPQEKALVVLAALSGKQTINQISSLHQVHPTQINLWTKQAKQGLIAIFSDKRKNENKDQEQLINELYKVIGQREIELAWLKKKLQPFDPRS